ncbi:MAG: ABC transporter substrate-binding protein [Coprothermobacterota bacterium]|nr:ABC transporter substrate-binding protein [Coprothermobacterota bacterium]
MIRRMIGRTVKLLGVLLLLLTAVSCSVPAPPTSSAPIKVGAIYNLTGAQAALDVPSANGTQLAVKQINAAGGVLGRTLELVLYDGKTDADTIRQAATKLVEDDRVVALIGFSDTDQVLVAAPAAEKAGIPFITSGASSPKLPAQVPAVLFLACFGDNTQAAAGAEYAYIRLKARNAYLLVDSGMEYARLLAGYFKESFLRLGGRILLEDTFTSGSKDLASQIGKLKALTSPPDLLFIACGPQDAGLVIDLFAQAGFNQPAMGGDSFDSTELLAVGGEAAEDTYCTTHGYLKMGSVREATRTFVVDYRAMFGHDPENAFAGLGYDAVKLLADALRRAGADQAEPLLAALQATQGLEGVTGTISYPSGSRIPSKSVTLLRVLAGQLTWAWEMTPTQVPAP